MENLFLLFALLLLFSACEGYLNGNGMVYDGSTGLPLDSVWVQAFIKKVKPDYLEAEMYTDTTGTFLLTTGMVGCTPKCPDLILHFSKAGFVDQEQINPQDTKVYLEKE